MPFRHLAAAAVFASVAVAGPVHAAPDAELWDRWTQHDPASTQTVDHSGWDALLKRHVVLVDDGSTRIDYIAIKAEDEAALDAYVDLLAGTDVDALNRAEQFAYWANMYNALTVQVIVNHFPVESIRDIDISPGLFSDGPWGRDLITVKGEDMSLDDIEHRILRPIWKDPRIHYAVNCASIGCPDLGTKAFVATDLDVDLNAAARAFINHPRGATVRDGRLTVSSIYDWFEEDFGGNDAGVIAHLKQYADADLAAALATVTSVSDDDYDWALNATSIPDIPQESAIGAYKNRGGS